MYKLKGSNMKHLYILCSCCFLFILIYSSCEEEQIPEEYQEAYEQAMMEMDQDQEVAGQGQQGVQRGQESDQESGQGQQGQD